MLPYAFATLDEFKRRLGITDALDDTLLQELLNNVAGVIESAAGRTLRRDHARTEYFPGGRTLICTDLYPIAKIHSVRESSTRDFETAGEYEELVEGTDYVLDSGPSGGRAGEHGFIRRLNQKWLGSERSPGQVRVVYTAGYKSDEETDLEDNTAVVSAAAKIVDYSVVYPGAFLTSDADETLRGGEVQPAYLPVVRFDLAGLLLPTWRVSKLTLSVAPYSAGGDVDVDVALLLTVDPLISSPADIYAAYAATDVGNVVVWPDETAPNPRAATTLEAQTSDALALFESSIIKGRISFIFSASGAFDVGSSRNATVGLRPSLTMRHWPTIADAFGVPGDLRNANLLQAVHEYRTKAQPGMISQSMRASTVASGASYLKTAADLLPEVRAVAESYRRMF